MILPTDAAMTTRRSSLGGTLAARIGFLPGSRLTYPSAWGEYHSMSESGDYRCLPFQQQAPARRPIGRGLPLSAVAAEPPRSGPLLRKPPPPPPEPPGDRTSKA